MPQVPSYSLADTLTGAEMWHSVQSGSSVRITPNLLKDFIGYTLPVANVGVLGGVKEGGDVTIDAAGIISVNNNSHTHLWSNVTNTPTTLAGYGITDAFPAHGHPWSEITTRPTVLAGYGITDAAPSSHLGGDIHIDWSITGAEQVHADRYTAGGGGDVTLDTDQTFTGLKTFAANTGGDLTDYDIQIGNTSDYGIIRLGSGSLGRTSHTAPDGAPTYNLNGAFFFENSAGPITGDIEFIFLDSAGLARFALPKSAVGNATYSSRSMLIAGPAIADSDIVTIAYWQGEGIFDNLVCDTGGVGADLGVQNDLEVEGIIFIDTIKESTLGAGVTIDGLLIKDSEVNAGYF